MRIDDAFLQRNAACRTGRMWFYQQYPEGVDFSLAELRRAGRACYGHAFWLAQVLVDEALLRQAGTSDVLLVELRRDYFGRDIARLQRLVGELLPMDTDAGSDAASREALLDVLAHPGLGRGLVHYPHQLLVGSALEYEVRMAVPAVGLRGAPWFAGGGALAALLDTSAPLAAREFVLAGWCQEVAVLWTPQEGAVADALAGQ